MNKKLLISIIAVMVLTMIFYALIWQNKRWEPPTLKPRLTDQETSILLMKKIDPFLDEYNLSGVPIKLNVSSKDGNQTMNLELQTSSLDVANNAAFFFWTLPHFAMFDDINTEGANIVFYQAKVIDEQGSNLMNIACDFRSGSCDLTKDERLRQLGEGPPQ